MSASAAARRILVTGASTGLGLATAQALRQQGCAVVVHVRDDSRLPGIGGISSWHDVVIGDLSDRSPTPYSAAQAGASRTRSRATTSPRRWGSRRPVSG